MLWTAATFIWSNSLCSSLMAMLSSFFSLFDLELYENGTSLTAYQLNNVLFVDM